MKPSVLLCCDGICRRGSESQTPGILGVILRCTPLHLLFASREKVLALKLICNCSQETENRGDSMLHMLTAP